jgi:Uncharacterised nucleotidyltransferase
MNTEPELRRLALSLLGPKSRKVADASVSEADWNFIDSMLREHRLQPLLHAELRQSEFGTSIPNIILERWRSAHREAGIRALVMCSVLAHTSRQLDQADIRWVALKGSSLAWRNYPSASLRPMRDMTSSSLRIGLRTRGWPCVRPVCPRHSESPLRMHGDMTSTSPRWFRMRVW